MSSSGNALNRKSRGRTRQPNCRGKSSAVNSQAHYINAKTNLRDGIEQERNRQEAENRALALDVAPLETCRDELEPRRIRKADHEQWFQELGRRGEKYQGFGIVRILRVGQRLGKNGAEELSEAQANAFLSGLDSECYYIASRADRPGKTRRVWTGLVMVTVTREPYSERAIRKAIRSGAIPTGDFLDWHQDLVRGYPDVLRAATGYRGSKGIEAELVVSHSEQGMFHDHLFCRDCDLNDHSRLGFIGSADRVVWNSLGMALIGARRQRRLGFQPIPLLRKAENRLFVVSDWSALDRQLQERRGESQSLGERLSRWTLEGSDPREDPRVLSRNLGLGDPWDIHLADYVDERVRLLRKQFPRAEHLFMEALELEKDINVSKVREASIEIVHKLRAAGWSRKQILGEGIDPDLDPLEAKVREAVKQTEAARRQIEEAGRVRAAAEARAEALLKENASLHAKSREAKKQVEASNLQAAEAKRAQAAAEARVEAVSKSNTELQAQVRVAGKMPSRPPEFTANDIIDALNAANNAVNTGKGLMNVLTSRQREIVRIMPATRLKCLESMGRFEVEMQRNLKGELELVREPNPTAGRLGLTTTVAQFVEGQILRAMEILSTDPIELSVADFESARSQLLAYTAVQKSARISLGFAPETPAQAAPEQEPAHTMAP